MNTQTINTNQKVLVNKNIKASFLIWTQFLFPHQNIDSILKIIKDKNILIDYLNAFSVDNEFTEFLQIIDYIKEEETVNEILSLYSYVLEVILKRMLGSN